MTITLSKIRLAIQANKKFFRVLVSGIVGMEAWKVAFLSVGIFILGMLISAVAVVFYHRWTKQHGPLITGAHPQLSANL